MGNKPVVNGFTGGGDFPHCDSEFFECKGTGNDKDLKCHWGWTECVKASCTKEVPNPAIEENERIAQYQAELEAEE